MEVVRRRFPAKWFEIKKWLGSKNALHWRRGALLRYGPATAKVWATQGERYDFRPA